MSTHAGGGTGTATVRESASRRYSTPKGAVKAPTLTANGKRVGRPPKATENAPAANSEQRMSVREFNRVMRAQDRAFAAAQTRIGGDIERFQNAKSIMGAASRFQTLWQGAQTRAERSTLLTALGNYYDRISSQVGRYDGAQARKLTPYQRAFYQFVADYGSRKPTGHIDRLFHVAELAGGPKSEDLPTVAPRSRGTRAPRPKASPAA